MKKKKKRKSSNRVCSSMDLPAKIRPCNRRFRSFATNGIASRRRRDISKKSGNLSRASDRFAEDDSVAGRIERIARITTYCIHEFWTAMACASSPRGPATHQGQSMQTTKRVRASRRAKQPALSLSSLANDASRSPDTCRLSLLRG